MMNARQMCETMNQRDDIIKLYCKKNKIKKENLKNEDWIKIKQSAEWRKIIPNIMKGY